MAAVVGLALAIVMIDGFDLQCIGFVAPEITREWGLPISAFGPTFSAALAGSMLGAMAAGTAVRRWGLKGALIGVPRIVRHRHLERHGRQLIATTSKIIFFAR